MITSIDELGAGEEFLAAASNVAVAAGHLLFIRDETLMAQPFDPETATFIGDAVPVAEDVLHVAGARLGAFSVSQTGVLIYHMGLVETQSELVWVDRDGDVVQDVSTGGLLFDVMISPDNRSAAIAQLEMLVGSPDIWIYDLERGLSTRFTFDPTNDWYPAWSPDGRRLAFASAREGNEDIWVKEVGGAGRAELLLEGGRTRSFRGVGPRMVSGSFMNRSIPATTPIFGRYAPTAVNRWNWWPRRSPRPSLQSHRTDVGWRSCPTSRVPLRFM